MTDGTLLMTKDKRMRMSMLGGVLIRIKLHVKGRGYFQKNKKYSDGNSGENTKGTIDGENFSGGGGRGVEDAVLKRTGSPKEFRSTERGPREIWEYSSYYFEVFRNF